MLLKKERRKNSTSNVQKAKCNSFQQKKKKKEKCIVRSEQHMLTQNELYITSPERDLCVLKYCQCEIIMQSVEIMIIYRSSIASLKLSTKSIISTDIL